MALCVGGWSRIKVKVPGTEQVKVLTDGVMLPFPGENWGPGKVITSCW